MVQHRKFMELELDDEGLHTPDGTFGLGSITRAEIVRHRERDAGTTVTGPSTAGVVGGAVIGGAVAGPVGALGGGLLGSTIKGERHTEPGVPRTVSASVVFESPELAYTMTVGRDRLSEAEAFVTSVKEASGIG